MCGSRRVRYTVKRFLLCQLYRLFFRLTQTHINECVITLKRVLSISFGPNFKRQINLIEDKSRTPTFFFLSGKRKKLIAVYLRVICVSETGLLSYFRLTESKKAIRLSRMVRRIKICTFGEPLGRP